MGRTGVHSPMSAVRQRMVEINVGQVREVNVDEAIYRCARAVLQSKPEPESGAAEAVVQGVLGLAGADKGGLHCGLQQLRQCPGVTGILQHVEVWYEG